ncbi:hypothetical protein GGR54DRAFT_642490 [Hypoxylon sp. NC1633]|nr:hypothetical protein GGR54DRAFT_642490 [Hypoxylon sp. NC1633]
MPQLEGTKLREEAKKMAADRRVRKAKYRMIRRQVIHKYKPDTLEDVDAIDIGCHDTDDDEKKEHSLNESKSSVWDFPACSPNGKPAPKGVTLRTMLRTAEHCYKLASEDFDKMSLYDHIHYIQESIHPKLSQDELSRSIIDDKLYISMAQRQLQSAQENFMACIAKLAIVSNLPEEQKGDFKMCRDCGEWFRPHSAACSCDQARQACFHNPCQYHPGQIRSYADSVVKGGKPLGENFLQLGRISLKEFPLWISTCYWDCCGGKLIKPSPDATKRSQRHKKDALKKWEVAHPMDESVGCQVRDRHMAMS